MRMLLFALLLLGGIELLAQDVVSQYGRVTAVSSAWATNEFGDQVIVSRIDVTTPHGSIHVDMDGGTIDDLVFETSDGHVPDVGQWVWIDDIPHGRWRLRNDPHSGDPFVLQASIWPNVEMLWFLNPHNDDLGNALTERDAVRGAYGWSSQPELDGQTHANFLMRYGGRTAQTNTGFDRVNVVVFRDAYYPNNPRALATAHIWSRLGVRLDADIIVWDKQMRSFADGQSCISLSGGGYGAYLWDVLAHEFGHVLGLSHSLVTGATMAPYYRICSASFRTLSADDIAGADFLYPE